MYERSPQKSPQLTILNLRSGVLTDNPNALVYVPKSVCRVLKWVSGYPGKRSRQSEITLQAIAVGMARLERESFSVSFREANSSGLRPIIGPVTDGYLESCSPCSLLFFPSGRGADPSLRSRPTKSGPPHSSLGGKMTWRMEKRPIPAQKVSARESQSRA